MKTKYKVLIATILIGGAIVGVTSDKLPTSKAASTVTIKHGVVTVIPDATPVPSATPSVSGVADLPTQTASPSPTPTATPIKKNVNIILGTPEPIPSNAVCHDVGGGTTVCVSN